MRGGRFKNSDETTAYLVDSDFWKRVAQSGRSHVRSECPGEASTKWTVLIGWWGHWISWRRGALIFEYSCFQFWTQLIIKIPA